MNKFKIVTTWDELRTLVKHCISTRYASIDFETTGTNAMYPGSKPTILGVSFQIGSSWIIPLAHKDSPFKHEWVRVLKFFGREIVENPDITKIGQNLKFEGSWFKKYGIRMLGRVFDTMLAKYLLDEERPHGLKDLVTRFIPEYSGYDLPNQPSKKAPTERVIEFWSNVPLLELSRYCGLDTDLAFRLFIFFESRLISGGFYPLFRNMYMMATRVLTEVEYHGMYIDTEYLNGLVEVYETKIDECNRELRSIPSIVVYEKHRLKTIRKDIINNIREEIKQLADSGASSRSIKTRENKLSVLLAGGTNTKNEAKQLEPLNFNSTKQMIGFLFEDPEGLKLDPPKFTETGNPSTDEESLLELKNSDDSGFLDKLLELRGLSKIYSTYVKGIQEKVNSNGKVHASFLLHGTVTNRLSSRDPNLQNIPRNATAADIKRMFIPPPGEVIMQVDYSQAELRVLAFEAGEKTMMEWFQTGKDIHLASACKKWGVGYESILTIYKDENHPEHSMWAIRRKQAKTLNFGIVYGQTAGKLAINLSTDTHKVSKDEAQDFLDDFNNQFPRIARYIKNQHKKALRDGYVRNLFGAKRRLPNVYSNNLGQKLEALRQSVNAPIQGAASNYTLFSSILIWEATQLGLLPAGIKQVGTVHDSIIFYLPPDIIHKSVPIIDAICANPETKEWFNFEVKGLKMAVDFEVGKDWGDLKNYDPNRDYTKFN